MKSKYQVINRLASLRVLAYEARKNDLLHDVIQREIYEIQEIIYSETEGRQGTAEKFEEEEGAGVRHRKVSVLPDGIL